MPQQSGHAVLNAANDKGVLECSTCHGVHEKSAGNKGALLPGAINPFGSLEALITVEKTENNAQCTACHDDAQTWYKASQTSNYPTAESYESTLSIASGYKTYPTSGTYPGSTVYNSTSKNGHMKIAAQDTYDTGDCRYCHSSHGSSSQYDGLLAARGEVRAMMATGGVVSDEEKTSGAYASFCLSCHNGSNDKTPWASAPDIASQVALPAGSSEESRTAFLLSAAGHRVSSANADVPAGSALPCYSCHNPHGSKNGNAYNLNDTLGSNLAGERNTCFTCHTSSDGFVLAAAGSSYTAVSSSTPECVGLSRTGNDTINGEQVANKLKLPDGIEAHTKDGTMECSGCHGGVHDPLQASGTGDSDGKSCLQCHNGQEFSEALKYEFTASDSSEAVDWENGYNPHLIPAFSRSLSETFLPESILSPAVQPIIPMSMRMSTQTINKQKYVPQVRTVASGDVNGTTKNVGPYCTGCHAWHKADVGSTISPSAAGRDSGNTLRKNYNSLETANTDYIHTPGSPKLGGLCLSCHNDYLGDSSVGAPTRGPLNDLNKLDSELFNNCFHNYSIELTRPTAAGDQQSEKSKTYYANCAKCHNDADAIANPLENLNTLDLKVHYVPGRRLLARFGILANVVSKTTSGTNEENLAQNYNTRGMCFGCHSRKGEIAGNAGKQYAGKD